ncbi:GH3 auxin-responsive promoter family protein [Leptolyngbya ohadii]|uniref:GH3 auxin-responsive promoter family protein n=1 Tax=Leptolyngbya ohadii TaxID=1962290 RepID=UPI000B599D4F|nr:GH3 auxin-responsive promoter family protein [Leptolyngbya ohadii]
MNSLVLPFLKAYGAFAKNNLVRLARDPIAAQDIYLQTLLRRQRGTELGQKFGLGEVQTIDQFREQVPIWSYEDYEPFMQRIANGESNVLTADPVVYLNLTSGTTGKQKMIPVTKRFQRSLGQANAASFGFIFDAIEQRRKQGKPPVHFGRLLSTNSVKLQGHTPAGIPYGPVTVGSFRMNRRLCEISFAQPFAAMEIGESLSRHYACILFALANPHVRGMSSNFPMSILRTCGILEEYGEQMIEDIDRGTIAPWLNLDPKIRANLEQRWRSNPRRAAELRSILKAEGRLTPKTVWSELSFIGTSRGGTSDFYFERFPQYFGNTPVFGGVYGTAEGTFAIYTEFDRDAAVLALESGFYEFIPSDQWDVAEPRTLLASELKQGEHYRILVTTYSGVYRYDIGDVIQVVGFLENTPLIIFRHRRGGLLSSTTEKTTEFHLAQTLQVLQQEFGLTLNDFCVTLSDREFPARYLLNIELAPGQALSQPQAFLHRFDRLLGEFNNPYATVRSAEVPPPFLRILAPGSFDIVKQRQILRGASDTTLKVPHLSEDRQFLADLEVREEIKWEA